MNREEFVLLLLGVVQVALGFVSIVGKGTGSLALIMGCLVFIVLGFVFIRLACLMYRDRAQGQKRKAR